MKNEFKPVHGFRLNARRRDGKAGTFLLTVLPERIVALTPLDPSGAVVRLKQDDGEDVTHAVTQSVGEIEGMIARCNELDAEQRGSGD